MGGSAGGSMGHAMSNMGSLAACSVSDSKPMQFPLAQRRKRRVLFTQAQVSEQLISPFYSNAGTILCIIIISDFFPLTTSFLQSGKRKKGHESIILIDNLISIHTHFQYQFCDRKIPRGSRMEEVSLRIGEKKGKHNLRTKSHKGN